MRIMTGKLKGRVIKMPPGIRPTQNRVRKAIFDILGDISGLSILELFAGSGAVGLEAMSQGAVELILVESDRNCCLAIEKNIESLKVSGCRLYPLQAEEAIKMLYKARKRFHLVFLDPPYYTGLGKKILQMLAGYDILAPNAFIIVEHFRRDDLPVTLGALNLFKQSRYSDSVLSFYRKNVPESDISRNL